MFVQLAINHPLQPAHSALIAQVLETREPNHAEIARSGVRIDALGRERFMARLVPDGDPLYRHCDEGPDDMPAHVRAALTAVQLSIPMRDGRLMLGTWQAIYLWEQRTHPHRRQIVVHVAGEGGEPVC